MREGWSGDGKDDGLETLAWFGWELRLEVGLNRCIIIR